MSGDTIFSSSVHFPCSYLNLERYSLSADNSGVKRLIHISLRSGNIILKSVRDRSEHIVDYAKYVIALGNCIDDNSYGIAIIYLVYLLTVTIYLFIDTVIAFNSTLDKGNRVKVLFKPVMYLVFNILNKLFTAALS